MGTPSVSGVKTLFAHSRNLCFFNIVDGGDRKTCEVPLTQLGQRRCLGEVAHISADKPGGPRYDPTMSEPERQSERNLILLCPNCHKRIDDLEPERFTVQALQAMKERHLQHRSDEWQPSAATLSQVAEDMVAYFIERLGRGSAQHESDDDAPTGVMGSSGIGFMSESVGPLEARQMWVDGWRSGQTPESLEAFRRANRRERRLQEVLEKYGLSNQAYVQYGEDDDTLTVQGAVVDAAVLRELADAGEFLNVRNETP